MTPTEKLIHTMVQLGCPAEQAFTLVHEALQWAAGSKPRSRHAEAQARYHAKKMQMVRNRIENGSELIISDQTDQNQKKEKNQKKENIYITPMYAQTPSLFGAEPVSDRQVLYSKYLEKLKKLTKNSENSLRSLLGRWSKMVDGDFVHVMGAIDDAERDEPADPRGYIFGRLQRIASARPSSLARPLTSSKYGNII